jgi:hypothetical protein
MWRWDAGVKRKNDSSKKFLEEKKDWKGPRRILKLAEMINKLFFCCYCYNWKGIH